MNQAQVKPWLVSSLEVLQQLCPTLSLCNTSFDIIHMSHIFLLFKTMLFKNTKKTSQIPAQNSIPLLPTHLKNGRSKAGAWGHFNKSICTCIKSSCHHILTKTIYLSWCLFTCLISCPNTIKCTVVCFCPHQLRLCLILYLWIFKKYIRLLFLH